MRGEEGVLGPGVPTDAESASEAGAVSLFGAHRLLQFRLFPSGPLLLHDPTGSRAVDVRLRALAFPARAPGRRRGPARTLYHGDRLPNSLGEPSGEFYKFRVDYRESPELFSYAT